MLSFLSQVAPTTLAKVHPKILIHIMLFCFSVEAWHKNKNWSRLPIAGEYINVWSFTMVEECMEF